MTEDERELENLSKPVFWPLPSPFLCGIPLSSFNVTLDFYHRDKKDGIFKKYYSISGNTGFVDHSQSFEKVVNDFSYTRIKEILSSTPNFFDDKLVTSCVIFNKKLNYSVVKETNNKPCICLESSVELLCSAQHCIMGKKEFSFFIDIEEFKKDCKF